MRTLLTIDIWGEDKMGKRIGRVRAHKEVDLPFVPRVGMVIEHPTWESGRKVVSVSGSIDPEDKFDAMYVYFGRIEAKSKEDYDSICEMYRTWKWDIH